MFMMSLFSLFFQSAEAQEISKKKSSPPVEFFHGFRVGYGYTNVDPDSHSLLESKWLYLIGYEVNQIMYGGDWIDVLFVQNISVVGLNQSLFIPSGNALIGFEFHKDFQIASGVNFVPGSESPFHMVVAAGWTPQVGDINIPCHVTYVPDVNNQWRMYLTTGVNW